MTSSAHSFFDGRKTQTIGTLQTSALVGLVTVNRAICFGFSGVYRIGSINKPCDHSPFDLTWAEAGQTQTARSLELLTIHSITRCWLGPFVNPAKRIPSGVISLGGAVFPKKITSGRVTTPSPMKIKMRRYFDKLVYPQLQAIHSACLVSENAGFAYDRCRSDSLTCSILRLRHRQFLQTHARFLP